jgi:hypothetical protein
MDKIVEELINIHVHHPFELEHMLDQLYTFARVHHEVLETNKTIVEASEKQKSEITLWQTRYDDLRSRFHQASKPPRGVVGVPQGGTIFP